jgi:hypothetical protein
VKFIPGVCFCGSTARDDNSGTELSFATLRGSATAIWQQVDGCGPKEDAVTGLGKLYDQGSHIFGFT